MKNVTQKNHQETEDGSGSQSGAKLFFGNFVAKKITLAVFCRNQGAFGIVFGSPNCFSSQFLRIFRRLFLFIFIKRCLESLDKFCLMLGVGFFKSFDLRLKLPGLKIGKVHGKIVDVFAKISSFFQKCVVRFAFAKYAEFVERAKRMFDNAAIMILFFLPPHEAFLNIDKVATSRDKGAHPAWSAVECSKRYLSLYNKLSFM